MPNVDTTPKYEDFHSSTTSPNHFTYGAHPHPKKRYRYFFCSSIRGEICRIVYSLCVYDAMTITRPERPKCAKDKVKQVPKKISEPVSEKFGTGALFCCQNFGIQKISNGYRNWFREFVIFSGGIGTGIGQIWYPKKVSEPVSVKFGTEKSTGIGIETIWYRKNVSVSVSFNILGIVTHWATN